jgi:nucleoside-diphosphate-sugar epimerase
VAGHTGRVGSAIVRRLETESFSNLLFATSSELDLRNQALVDAWFAAYRQGVEKLLYLGSPRLPARGAAARSAKSTC